MSLLHRRSLLRGMFALPAIVACNNLMPISSKAFDIILKPTIHLQYYMGMWGNWWYTEGDADGLGL